MFTRNCVDAVEYWRVTRLEGTAILAQVWDSMLHVGVEPDASERSSSDDSAWGVRLCPSIFDVRTPIVDEDEDADDGLTTNDVVQKPPSSDASGVHLRMPPSSRGVAGTKRVACPAGGSYPRWVTSWLGNQVVHWTQSIVRTSKDVSIRFVTGPKSHSPRRTATQFRRRCYHCT